MCPNMGGFGPGYKEVNYEEDSLTVTYIDTPTTPETVQLDIEATYPVCKPKQIQVEQTRDRTGNTRWTKKPKSIQGENY